jgi:hypothetical protein
MGNSNRILQMLLAFLCLISPACGARRDRAEPTVQPTLEPTVQPTTKPVGLQEEPTLQECRQWLASSQELAVPIACPTWSFFRDELFEHEGGVFPIGDDRYYLVLFPDDWETVTDRKVIVSLHGTGGCAEWMLNRWYQTSWPAHSWAVVALQYYDPTSDQYDGDEVIYRNLRAILDDLHAHCPVGGSDVFYHGFSRGSAQSFPVAIRDRAGRQAFAAFIADSGCAGLDYPTLQDAPQDALAGARFWMWCGQNDVSTVDADRMTCEAMEEDMRPYVEAHGGRVDALIQEAGVAHGMFSGCPQEGSKDCSTRTAENLGPSLPLLFDYIEAFPELPPAAQRDVGRAVETAEGDDAYGRSYSHQNN